MKISKWLTLVVLGFVAACTDGPTEPEAAGLTGSDPSSPAVTQPSAPTSVAHFSLTSNGDDVGPTVTTDKEDYQPGDTVTISGSGWQAGETVELLIEEDTPGADPLVFSSVADDNGDFVNRDFVIEERHLGVTFTLTATGLTSGMTAGATFTDDNVQGAPVETRESTCTTAQTSFSLGSAVCARAGAVSVNPPAGSAGFRIQWVGPSPATTILKTDSISSATNGSYYTRTYTPSAAGTYTVRTCKGLASDCADAGQQLATASFTITAPPSNTAPVLTLPANHSIQWGVALADTAKATDNESPPQTLTFSLLTPLVTGVSINGSTGVIAWTPTAAQIGANTITVRVVDSGSPALADTASYVVTVTARPASLVYDGKLAGQYSDNDTLSATLTDNGDGAKNGDPIVGESVSFVFDAGVSNLAAGSDNTDSNGQAAVLYQIPKPDGNYYVTANFAGGSGYSAVSDTVTFDVDPEDATVDVTDNPGSVSVTGPGGNSLPFSIKVRIQESTSPAPEPDENDGALPGDITKAGISVGLSPITGGAGPAGSCGAGTLYNGPVPAYAAYVEFTCNFSNVPVNTYTVEVGVTGGYYDGSTDDVLTVYDPSLGFVTGGGKFILDGDRVSFGFSVTLTKGKTAQRGGIVVVRHYAAGGRCRLKSNSVTTAITSNTTATLSSNKSTNYSCVYGDGTISGKGNLNLTAYVEDNGEPGNGVDRFWVNAYGDFLMPTPSPANAETLTGGNIQVPHKK